MNVKLFLSIVIILAIHNGLMAQNVLMLEKTRTQKKTMFKAGEDIKYKLQGENHYRQDYIVAIKDSSIVFHYNKVSLDEITEIDIRKKRFINMNLKRIGSTLQVAGGFYIILDQFNKTVVQGNEWEFEEDVWITGAVLMAIGTGIKFLHPKKFKVGGRYKLHIININYMY